LLCVRVLRRTVFVIVTPRILTNVTRSIPGSGGGGWAFPFRRLSTNTISMYFVGYTFKFLIFAQFCTSSLHAYMLDICLSAAAVYSRNVYTSRQRTCPFRCHAGVMAFRSAALTKYETYQCVICTMLSYMLDHRHRILIFYVYVLDTCMTLAVILCNGESNESGQWRIRPSSCLHYLACQVARASPIDLWCRTVSNALLKSRHHGTMTYGFLVSKCVIVWKRWNNT